MQRDEFGGIVLDAPADSQQPTPASPAGQQRDEFGGIVVGSQSPALQQPHLPGEQQLAIQQHQQQRAENAQHGQLASFTIEALHPAGQVMAGLENFLAPAVGAFSPDAAANMQAHARILQDVRGAENTGGFLGGIAGNVPTMLNPAIAGTIAAGETYHGVEQQKAEGANISGTAETLDVVGQGVLNAAMSKVFGQTLVGQGVLARNLEAGLAQHVPALIAKYGARGAVDAAVQVLQQVDANQLTKATVNPQQDVLEGVLQAGGTGAGFGVLAQGAHDALSRGGVNNEAPPPQQPQALTSELAQGPKIPSQAELGAAVRPTGIFEKAQPKVRVNDDGGISRGIKLSFEDPVEKALYVLAQPRQGKLGVEAQAVLADAGISQEQVASRSAEVKARVEQMAQGHGGDVLPVPKRTEGTNVPVSSASDVAPPQQPAAVEAPVNGTAPQAEAPAEAPAALPSVGKPDVAAAVESAQGDIKRFRQEAPANKEQADAAAAFRKRGVEVVYFSGEGRGFRYKKHPGVLFVNAKNVGEGLREAVSHEFMHELHDSRPGLFQAFRQAVPDSLRQEFETWYSDAFNRMRPGEKPTNLAEEGVTTPFGRTAMSERVWREVLGKNPTLKDHVMDFFRKFVAKFSTKARLVNEAIKTFQATLDTPVGGGRRVPEVEAANFLPEPSDRVRQEAEEYARGAGVPYHPDTEYAQVNVERAKRTAAEYDAATHNPNDPKVKASYDAFKKETLDQWNYLQDKGVKFEAWDKEGQPYKDSAEMRRDALDNKHLYFFQGGDIPADHPLAEKAPGTPYTYNDVFRAVHDYFGHTKEGVGFGPRGEENAWRSHSQMYSDLARGAMTTETRGQNSWVNFGPHGEHNQANPTQTRFADQKATLLSPAVSQMERPQALREAGSALHETLRKQTGMDKLEAIRDQMNQMQAHMDDLLGKYPSQPEQPAQPDLLPDYKPRKEENKNTLRELQAHLTPAEYEGMNNDHVQAAIRVFNEAPADAEFEAAAKAGEAKRGWYVKAGAAIKTIFGKDTDRFTSLLAATSPQQPVRRNLLEALKIWNAWEKAGRPDSPERVRAIVEANTSLPARVNNSITSLTALAGKLPELSGDKVTAFRANLLGHTSDVTNDTWMAQFGGLDQKLFGTKGGYLGYAAKIRRVAKTMGWTPAEVQETVWSFAKALSERINKNTSGREALMNLKHEDIMDVPAFHDMLDDPDVKQYLDRLGISDRTVKRAGREAAATGPSTEHLSGYVAEGDTGVLERIAQRTEGTAKNKPSEGVKSQGALFLPSASAKPKEETLNVFRGIRSIFAPHTAGPEAGAVAGILRERGAELAQRFDRLNAAFDDTRRYFDGVSVPESRAFIDAIEKGQKQADPSLQPAADAIRTILDNRLAQVQGLGTGKLQQFVKDYFPHLWKDPKKAAAAFAADISKRPLEGGKKFLRQRTLPTMAEGIARGLEPVTENPVEAMMLRVREMDKYITAQQAFTEMQTRGLARKIKARDPMPVGYAKIDDNIATIYAKPSRRGAIQVQGYYVAPEPVANVVNNYLSPGLRGHKFFGGAFRGYLAAGNVMNQVQLGLSGFHLLNTTLDSGASALALSMKQLASGDFKGSAKSGLLAASLVGPAAKNLWQGSQLLKEWERPGSTTPEMAVLADGLKAAGGRVKMDDFYHTGATEKMLKAFRSGNILGGAFRAPFAAIEQSAKPIMEKIVPRMKLGVFMDMAKYELSQLGSGAPRAEVREALGRAWNSVDNRMGELVYDNLFWNKAAKDIAMASTRSVGWNLGTLRELGGGALDTLKLGKDVATGNFKNAEFTHRMAYSLAMPAFAGIIGGMTHYLLTGKPPTSLKDYFFPKTGEKDKDGHDVRLALPSYMKDVLAYGSDPVKTLGDKVHPMLNTIMEMLRNEDFYGTEIVNKDDPFMQKVLDEVKFAGKQFVPFGIREAAQLQGEGQGVKSILPLVGIVKARRDITNSPAEVKAAEFMREKRSVGSRTHEQADRSQLVRDIAGTMKTDRAGGIEALHQAIQGEKLVPSDVEQVKEHLKFGGLERGIRHLEMSDAMEVWSVASAEEKRTLGPLMFKKLRGATSITREDKVRYLKQLQADWKEVQP